MPERDADREQDHDRHQPGHGAEIGRGAGRGVLRQRLLELGQGVQALGDVGERALGLAHGVGADRLVVARQFDHVAHRLHIARVGGGGAVDIAALGAVRLRHVGQAAQAGRGQRMLLVDILDQGHDPALRETAADPGLQLVDFGVAALGRGDQLGGGAHVGGAASDDVLERGVLAHHRVPGAAGQQDQQHQHDRGRQQQFRTDLQARQHLSAPFSRKDRRRHGPRRGIAGACA